VIGDVAPTIGFPEFDPFLAEDIFGGEKIFLTGVTAEREHMRMLAVKQYIFDSIGLAGGDEALLQGIGVGPGEEAEVADVKWGHEMELISDDS
jgi:hypothetical protein